MDNTEKLEKTCNDLAAIVLMLLDVVHTRSGKSSFTSYARRYLLEHKDVFDGTALLTELERLENMAKTRKGFIMSDEQLEKQTGSAYSWGVGGWVNRFRIED